jgi:hypothetical protein
MRTLLLGLFGLSLSLSASCYSRTVVAPGPYGGAVACRQIWTPATPFRNGYWHCV